MKKCITLLLAVLMLLSLASLIGCKTEDETPGDTSPTQAGDAQQTNAGTPTDPVEGDDEMFVGVVCPNLEGEWLKNMLTSYCERVGEWGCTSQLLSAENDNTNFISIMENYLTMGAKLILCVAQDTEAVQDIVLRCIDEGCYVIMLGIWPEYEISGGLITDFYDTGVATAMMLIDWADKNIPGDEPNSLPVAVAGAEANANGVNRSRGFRETIDADTRTYVDYYKSIDTNSIDNGFTFAEEALTYNNNIRLFLMYETDPAIGVHNYVEQNPQYSLSEFCVVGVGQTDASTELIEQARQDPASCMLRGALSYGGPDPGIQLNEVSYKLLIDKVDPPYWMFDEMYTDNTWGWEVPAEF